LLIDQEVRKIIETAYDKTLDLIRSKREVLEAIAQELLSKEVIFKQDLERLAGPRPFDLQNAEIPAVPTPESANNPTNQEA
jgi:cell division protease FtsH